MMKIAATMLVSQEVLDEAERVAHEQGWDKLDELLAEALSRDDN